MLTHGNLSHFSMGSGKDPSNLGRWCWGRYRGKDGVVLRVVSVYRPCHNPKGKTSVGTQQKRHMQEVNDDRDPRTAFLEDFSAELTKWREMGDQIIVGGDLNAEVTSATIENLFAQHDMINLVFDRHNRAESPSTYSRNESNKVIDGIWATPNINVARCGYLESGEFPGDHCAIWVDIPYSDALGHVPPTPTTQAARRLKLRDSKCVERYIQLYSKFVQHHDLINRQFKLESTIHHNCPLTRAQEKEAEAIDRLRTQGMLHAERHCRKLNMGAVQYSMATEMPRRAIEFWRIAIRRRKGIRVRSRLWKRKKKLAKIEMPTKHLSIPDMYKELRAALTQYRLAAKTDGDSRLKFIETFPEKQRKRILREEEQRRQGRVARVVNGKIASQGVTQVQPCGPDEVALKDANGNDITYTNQSDIETCLLPINKAKGHSSLDTPPLQEPLLSDFGYNANNANADAVLHGEYAPPEETDHYAKLLFQQLSTPRSVEQLGECSSYITTEEHIQGWNRATEKTSAGISGLHFGMFKAHAKYPVLASLDASMQNVAYVTGYTYRRWQKGIDVQLLKRAKDHRAHKLRTILLLEADFNMNNKKLGRDVMAWAERAKELARDNYGGRKHLRAVEVSLNSTLTYNSLWSTLR